MEFLVLLYLVGFIRTLLVIVIIYFGIRIITRYVLPILVNKGMKNMQQKMQNQQRQNQQSSRPEGEVTIEKNRNQGSNNAQNQGEYVDFEEVD
jgi:hypothetical protein